MIPRARVAISPLQGVHQTSSGTSGTASRPMWPRMILADDSFGEVVAGLPASSSGEDDMGRHAHQFVAQVAEGHEVDRLQLFQRRVDHRQVMVESTIVRPWPGMCFITGSRPPAFRPSAAALPMAETICGSCP